jgi:hypothetical protein
MCLICSVFIDVTAGFDDLDFWIGVDIKHFLTGTQFCEVVSSLY